VHQDGGGKWVPTLDANGGALPAEILLAGIEATVNADGDIDVTFPGGAPTLSLPPLAFGDTGIVLTMGGIQLFLSKSQTPDGFKGFTASTVAVHLSGGLGIDHAPDPVTFTDLRIGSSGFSGAIDASWTASFDDATKTLGGTGVGELFGVPFAAKSLGLNIQQDVPVGASFKGILVLPFFGGAVDVDIGFGPNGKMTVGIDAPAGLATCTIEDVFDIALDSLGFEIADGELTAKLSGKITPTFGGLDWPSFDVKELAIDSKGHVNLDGGWLDLPQQYSFDFQGFKLDITKFGFGRNSDGTKWIGMSGAVELVKGLPAGASVKGLRITAKDDWSDPQISFEGVGVELAIPGVLQFKGEVDYDGANHSFSGDISLKLEAMDLTIDGTLVAGVKDGSNYFALFVDAELPSGIPLGPSGVAAYGFAGLLALQMGPNKAANQPWYDISHSGWYNTPTPGVEILSKWTASKGSRAFGAGMSFGTLADNGYSFNGRALLLLILPGPVIALQGTADILEERDAGSQTDPPFRTIAVLDKNAGTLLFGVDATYAYPRANGDLIKINGGLEAFYDFTDPTRWHLYLGLDEPRESRIQARVLEMFDADAYFMLDAHQLRMGSWIGFKRSWHFSKLSIDLEAWMENNAIVSFKPAHLHGDLTLHGSVQLKVFRFAAGLEIDAHIEADVSQPFHLLGDFRVGIHLPRPLKSIGVDVSLEWGPTPELPPKPIVLKDVAIEHFKSSVSWPLATGQFVIPNYGDGDGFLLSQAPSAPSDSLPPPAGLQRVPMDCRPSISFARNVWDYALVGIVAHPLDPEWEQIGDPLHNQGPVRMRYGLRSVQLDKFDGASWTTVAAATGSSSTGSGQLFGAWSAVAAVGGTGPAQNKLLLWSKSGLDQFRNSSVDGSKYLGTAAAGYPCFPPPGPGRICLDFEALKAASTFASPFVHPDHGGVSIAVAGQTSSDPAKPAAAPDLPSRGFTVTVPPKPIGGKDRMFCPVIASGLRIDFANPASEVRIVAATSGPGPIAATCVDAGGAHSGPFLSQDGVIEIGTANVVSVTLAGPAANARVCLVELCGLLAASPQAVALYQAMGDHNKTSTALWSGVGNVLEPYTAYRLRFVTTVETQDYPTLSQLQYAYFETGGPPGIGRLDVPANVATGAAFDNGLDDLTRYVGQTVPLTVPATGQKPLSPRPVYRGYDVGVVFNENYVSLMYRMAGRDLGLMLYDRNNLPMRDSKGRLLVAENPWGRNPTPVPSAGDQKWAAMVNANPCGVRVDLTEEPVDETLTDGSVDKVLDPDALYEARLVPSLLHEDFGGFALGLFAHSTGGRLGRWSIFDEPASAGGPSQWTVTAADQDARRIAQTGAIAANTSSMLVLGDFPGLPAGDRSQPGQWTDHRIDLRLRSVPTTAVGVAFRRSGPSTFYLFEIDPTASVRRLLRVSGGMPALLAQDSVVFAPNSDYRVVIEALGASLRVYVDDKPVFDVVDTAIPGGGMALYCSGGAGAAFSGIQVQDFSVNASPAYKFSFTTSPFVNYFHHLHSFDDGCWAASSAMSDTDLNQAVQRSTSDMSSAVLDDEARAFDRFASIVLGPASLQLAERTELVKVERAGTVIAFIVRGPQPFGFARTACQLTNAAIGTPTSISPMSAKIVAATVGAAIPADESMTILVRDPMDLSGCRIEKRSTASPASGGIALPADPLNDTASHWDVLFQFPPAEIHPAGTLVIVNSSSPDGVPTTNPRNVPYFIAPSGSAGTLLLSEAFVDLRLVAPDGEVLHARRFLKADDFGLPTHCKFLRRADETAFVIFPTGQTAESFAEGSYRLVMQYRRDNTANDHASVVLSEAGVKTPELATLDFSSIAFA
jgi:hypothetical protein